jgi:hypothetical protein
MKLENKLPEEVEGIKQSLENILNADFKIKRKKRTELDIQRDLFFKIILSLEKLNMRSNMLNIDLDIDLTKYDEVFYDAIDKLLLLKYGKEISEIIFFYVYDRIDPEGNITYLSDTAGKPVILETIGDLWYLIQNIKGVMEKKNK